MTESVNINSIESESGIIASLIHHPEFIYFSEKLLPNHFTDIDNQCVYTAIQKLAFKGITVIDPYNIMECLNSSEATRKIADRITIEKLNELVEMSDVLARHTAEEYNMLVKNVLDAALRRDTLDRLRECEKYCYDRGMDNLEDKIYAALDNVMTEFSNANEIPPFKDVVDGCWDEIRSRQGNGYAGIPFKFPTLNEYATIERGELFVFAAEAKQGKSMMLLNCAADLLKQDLSVLYLDSELNTRLFTARLIAHLTGIEYKTITSGAYSEKDAERIDKAIEWMKTRKFTHIYMPIFDTQSIYAAVRKVYHTQGIDVLILDYLKSSSEGDAFASYQELGRLSDLVKNRLAGDMGIAAIAAAQATATGKVADSAKIGRNASTIAVITDKTPQEIELDGPECGNKKLRVVLNRNGMQMAPDQWLDMSFDGNHILYEEAKKQHVPQEPY